jgi:hypothetical protein
MSTDAPSRFVLARDGYGQARHALAGVTSGPSLCAQDEPPSRWTLDGFTARDLGRIDCIPCRAVAARLLAGNAEAPSTIAVLE